MDGTGIQPTISLGNNDGAFGNGGGGLWLFAMLVLLGMGNGGLFGNNRNFGYQPQYATQQDVQFTSQFGQLLDGNRDIVNNITASTAQSVAATNQAKYDNINVAKDVQAALTSEINKIEIAQAQTLANQNQCCCTTQRAIDGVNYNNAINTANINANMTAQTQKILDAISGNRMADMQNQINQLQLNQAMSGVVRYPNQLTYNVGNSPFCNNRCGCLTNI